MSLADILNLDDDQIKALLKDLQKAINPASVAAQEPAIKTTPLDVLTPPADPSKAVTVFWDGCFTSRSGKVTGCAGFTGARVADPEHAGQQLDYNFKPGLMWIPPAVFAELEFSTRSPDNLGSLRADGHLIVWQPGEKVRVPVLEELALSQIVNVRIRNASNVEELRAHAVLLPKGHVTRTATFAKIDLIEENAKLAEPR